MAIDRGQGGFGIGGDPSVRVAWPTPDTARELVDPRIQQLPGVRQRELPPGLSWPPFIPFRGRWIKPKSEEIGAKEVRVLEANPNRFGAWLFNAGGQIEIPIPLPLSGAGLPLVQFIDSGGIAVPAYAASTYKSIYFVIDVQLTKAAGSQATGQLLVSNKPWPPASGSASQVDVGNTLAYVKTKGAAANILGAAVSTYGTGLIVLSPTDIADLQWQHPYIGIEFNWGGALTAGMGRLFLEAPGGPQIIFGEDYMIDGSKSGPRANGFALSAQAAPFLWSGDGELWAACSPGGFADLRIWEILYDAPVGAPSYG